MGPNLEKNHAELGEKPVDRGPVETRFAGVQSAADGACPLMEAAFGINVGSGDFFMPGARIKNTTVGMPTKCMTAGQPTPATDFIQNRFEMEMLTMNQANRDLMWSESENACGIKWNANAVSNIPDIYYPQQLNTIPSLQHKNYAITGCTSGTGFYCAKAAITKNANMVLLLNRHSDRATNAHNKLTEYKKECNSNTIIYTVNCDLQSFESVKKCAPMVEALCANSGGLDALVNNAGIMGVPDTRTVDGFDVQMQTNHLSHFLLSYLLMPSLELAADTRGEARIVQHSSGARSKDRATDLDTATVPGMLKAEFFNQCEPGTLGGDGFPACFNRYHQTKLSNPVFTMALHDLLGKLNSKVKSICADPGKL